MQSNKMPSIKISVCPPPKKRLTDLLFFPTATDNSSKKADCGTSSATEPESTSTDGQNLQNAAAAAATAANKTHEPGNKSGNQTAASSPNQNAAAAADPKGHLNELYLFSIKRPSEFKHYTHEIKFMKTPGCSVLSFSFIFTAILVISLLFTIVVYISGKCFFFLLPLF